MTCYVNHGNKQTKCSLYKCSFYQPAGLQMAWNMEQSGRKNTGWSSSTHFPLQSPSQGHRSGYGMSQFLAEVDSLNSSWYKSSSASYAPVFIPVPYWAPKV